LARRPPSLVRSPPPPPSPLFGVVGGGGHYWSASIPKTALSLLRQTMEYVFKTGCYTRRFYRQGGYSATQLDLSGCFAGKPPQILIRPALISNVWVEPSVTWVQLLVASSTWRTEQAGAANTQCLLSATDLVCCRRGGAPGVTLGAQKKSGGLSVLPTLMIAQSLMHP